MQWFERIDRLLKHFLKKSSFNAMNVSRVVYMDLSVKCTPRRFGVSTKQRCVSRNKPLFRKRSGLISTRMFAPSLISHCSNSEDQTVVDEQTEEVKDESSVEMDQYSGAGSSLVNSMIESAAEEEILPEKVQDWISLAKEQFSELENQIDETKKRVESSDSELEEMKAKYLRLSADFENYRKRADSERDQLRQTSKADVISTLLPLIDNFELAQQQTNPQTEGEEAIVSSFLGLYRQMNDLFTELGVEAIDCDQKPFDPEYHDAILREPNEEVPDGTVIQELRKGFTIKGKLIRPAMVKVSYSEVLQDAELPLEEDGGGIESTLEIEHEEEEAANEAEEAS